MNDIPDSTLADIERLAGVKRIDKRRMEELREEVGVKESHRNLARSQLKWTGHVERMEGERLTKRAHAPRLDIRRRRGRPRMRWEDCMKSHLAEVGGKLRRRARVRGSGDGWW